MVLSKQYINFGAQKTAETESGWLGARQALALRLGEPLPRRRRYALFFDLITVPRGARYALRGNKVYFYSMSQKDQVHNRAVTNRRL